MDNKIKRYLDRVVMELMGSTKIDFEKKKIHYPFFSSSLPFSSLPSIFSFSDYCKDKYGLTEEEEEDYVWDEYIKIIEDKIEEYRSNILDKIKTGPNKIKRYLDRVVMELVKDTKIVYKKNRTLICEPPLSHAPNPLFTQFPFLSSDSFSAYSKRMFGLTEDEIKYVWEEYKKIIKDKIEDGQ